MSTAKTILGVLPGLQSTALLGKNMKLLDSWKNPKNSKGFTKKFIKTGVTNFVGIGLIKGTSDSVNALS